MLAIIIAAVIAPGITDCCLFLCRHPWPSLQGLNMNAAVTFTSCALGRMSWKKFPVYVLGSFLGLYSGHHLQPLLQ